MGECDCRGGGRAWRVVGVAVLVCVAAASASVAFRVQAVTTGPVADLAARSATVSASVVLTDDPKLLPRRAGRFARDRIVVPATLVTIRTRDARLAVDVPVTVFATGREWTALLPSQRLDVTARLARPTPGDLTAAVLLVRGPPQVLTPPSSLQTAAGAVRAGLREAAGTLPPEQAGLLPGLVVGDVSRMDQHVAADLKEAGLSHLTAVSGANLAIVAGAALALSRVLGLSLPLRASFAAIAMVAFAVVARPSPSVLRALLMGLVAAVALGTGRTKDGVAALSATVLLLVLFAPELARSYGFALSVAATAGILLLAPRWRDALCGASGRVRLPRWAAEAMAVPAAAQAAVTPVLVLMSGQVSLVAVPANLLVAPAVAPATLLGFGAALVAPFWPEAARLLVIPAGHAVQWIITVAGWAAAVPYATVPWPGGLGGLALLAAVVAMAVPVLRRPAGRAAVAVMAGAALVVALAVRPLAGPWPPSGWLMVMCDVGQGDGLVLAAGPGRGVIVDTGPDPVVMDRCLRRLGVSDVPLVILTHPHADHVDGLSGVLRGRRVGAVLVTPERTAPDAESRLSTTLARQRIPEWTAPPGTRWRFGPSEVTVIAPEPAHEEVNGQGEGSVSNNASVVVHVRWRAGSALLTGDIETEVQEELVRQEAVRADVLKIPHHGSPRQSPDFLSSVGARAALVSVGAGNDYGHPADSTLALMRRLGARVYRTDQSGDIAVVDQEGTLAVLTRRPP
ncbi:competence protein ComEC [Nonomuraea pusilla]|uniref:Competence protein ComEC n=1 Tax=Nonomuraea pusilla TaxID=46177 RepID=A0A1H7S8K7_9ACTN|nr:competence protein ComEC [Nonomuraea pusilla]